MAWKVENIGKRAFISKPEDFLKGGEFDLEKKHKYLNPGKSAEVTEEYGAALSTYKEVRVISRSKKKE